MFITFEGTEGSGKSLQARLLVERLRQRGIGTLLTHEPGGTPLGGELRQLLLTRSELALAPRAEALLMNASRAQLVDDVIRPALQREEVVVCDRFADSTRVYQGALGKVDGKLIRGLERVTVGAAMPDLTFVLDVPASVGLARATRRRGSGPADRYESETVEFHENLRTAYRVLSEEEPNRIVVIDGRPPRDVVAARIWEIVCERLSAGNALLPEGAAS